MFLRDVSDVSDVMTAATAATTDVEELYLELLLGSERFEKVAEGDLIRLVRALKDDELVGYLFTASGQGYSSEVKTLVGVNPEGVIKGIEKLNEELAKPKSSFKSLIKTLIAVFTLYFCYCTSIFSYREEIRRLLALTP